MHIELPTRLHTARTIRVHSYNCIEANIDLDFGVSVRKKIVLEGIGYKDVSNDLREDAKHALVVLVGGKRLVVHINGDNSAKENYILGRVFLAERVHGNPEGMMTPYGLDTDLLEVSVFYHWLKERRFSMAAVRAVLNGVKV